MNTLPSSPRAAVTISRVADNQWHAIENDLVVGRGHASRRLDGRTFLSIDTWHAAVFDRLADAMVADHSDPLYTVVDETDHELAANWERAGFTTWRREREFVVPTAPHNISAPGVVITTADEELLRELDHAIRTEVQATVGWHTMPAEVLPWQGGSTPIDPSKYTIASKNGRYVGLVRLATMTRQPRIGLIAVLAGERREGIARALLSHVLTGLHRSGIATVSAEVNETNEAAMALFESFGARRTGSNLELVRQQGRV